MIKFRLYYDKDKAEVFLNKMSSRGYEMKSMFAGLFFFEKSYSNDYTYRIDLINGKSLEEKSDYIQLVKDSGGEFVQKWGPWIFFRKKGDFHLYSDNESKITFYSRVRRMFFLLAMAELCISISQWSVYFEQTYNKSQKNISLFNGSLLVLLGLVFIYQVFKCSSKIKALKESI